jgi:hypothetical protein
MNNKSEVQAATANNSSIVTIKYMPAKNLRDEFAMAAINVIAGNMPNEIPTDKFADLVAKACYVLADAMLRARGE